jgi:RNA polymerase sigma-70 factor (ECF subfamily)
MTPASEEIARVLNAERAAFKAFLVARVGDEAEDILQPSLVKALARAGRFDGPPGRITAWFYRILRNAIVDHYRHRQAVRQRDEAFGAQLTVLGEHYAGTPPEWEKRICACLNGVIATLPGRQAELLRRVDLNGEAVRDAGAAMGLTANLAGVTLHRARRGLRTKLAAFCGACAADACLDCHCESIPGNTV